MTESELQRLLDEVSTGSTETGTAASRILDALRAAPFDDLGFARVDHHRHLRQGFPEVVLGLGKTPAQIASISERIVSAGHSLLVTRTTLEAFDAVRDVVPNAAFHGEASAITLAQGEIVRGHGTILVACAGTSDLPVAEEAVVTAELMGNVVDRLYDVGVAGLHRLLSEHDRLQRARVLIVVAGMEGALPSVDRRAGPRAGDCRTNERRLWRQLRRHCGAAGNAQQLRQRSVRREHRQRVWGGLRRQPD